MLSSTDAAVPRFNLGALLRGRLTTGVFWNVISVAFNQGSTFVLGIIVANMLGRELYGSYGLLQSTLLTFSSMAQLALGLAATKHVAELRVNDKERTGQVIAVCIAFSVVAGSIALLVAEGGARPIAAGMAHQPGLASLLRLASPAVLFTVVTGVLTGVLAGLERFRPLAYAGVAAGIAYIIICAVGVIGWKLQGVAAGLALSAAAQCLLLVLVVRREVTAQGISLPKIDRKLFLRERAVVWTTAVPAALAGMSTTAALWLATIILARQTDGISQLSLFTAANSLRLLVNFLPALINNVGFSVLSNKKGVADVRGFWKIFRANLLAVTGIAVAGAAAMAVVGPWVLRIFGRSFEAGYPVLLILLVVSVSEGLIISLYQLIQTQGRFWLSFICVVIPRDLTTLAAALLLTPRYGGVGLACAFLAGAGATLLTALLLVRGIHRDLKLVEAS